MGDIEKGRCWIKVVQMDNFRGCKENRYNTEGTGQRIVWNGKEQIRLKEVRARSEKGPKKQSEWIKVNGGENKKVV